MLNNNLQGVCEKAPTLVLLISWLPEDLEFKVRVFLWFQKPFDENLEGFWVKM